MTLIHRFLVSLLLVVQGSSRRVNKRGTTTRDSRVDAGDCGTAVAGAVEASSVLGRLERTCQCPREGWIVADEQACTDKLAKQTLHKFDKAAFAGLGCRCLYEGNDALPWEDHFKRYMADLKVTANPEKFNEKCEPYVTSPTGHFDTLKKDGYISSERGLILLTHGYTACANWWYLVVPRLKAEGWTVMVPNLVGHGRTPTIERNGGDSNANATYTITDYIADMPENYIQYKELSHEMIKIVRKYKDTNPEHEIAMAGISLGGAITTYMSLEAPELWDRVLLMNPFLAAPTGLGQDKGLSILKDLIPRVLPAFKVVQGDRISWGPDCEQKWWPGNAAGGGHGGICQFSIENFVALLDFANMVEGEARSRAAGVGVFDGGVLDRVQGVHEWFAKKVWRLETGTHRKRRDGMKFQVLTASNDGAISNGRVHFTAEALTQSLTEGNVGYCVLPQEFMHVWICPIDNLGRDHWWLDASRTVEGDTALDLIDNFLSEGTLVSAVKGVVHDDPQANGDPRCDLTKKL